MSAIFELAIAEIRSEFERMKLRVARLEREPKVVVVTADDLAALQKRTGKTKDRCLIAIRDSAGDLKEAAVLLEAS
jgi:hypothetical protein